MPMEKMPTWQDGEEFVNSLTHAIGAVVFSVMSVFIVRKSIRVGGAARVWSAVIFCLGIIQCYTVSGLYHGLTNERYKRPLRSYDHCCVYFLIAASYAPFCLRLMRGHGGLPMLVFVWAVAIVGSVGKIFFFDLVDRYTTLLYVAMGWVGTVSIRTILKVMKWRTFLWLLLGGISYTIGALFYSRARPFDHAIFHLFVIGGTACHAISVHFYT
jgi:hemolysin III